MRRRFLAVGGALVLALSGLLLVSPAHASPATCSKVLFIGVRGSGETADPAQLNMGPTVFPVYQVFRGNVPKDVAVEGVGLDATEYPASPVVVPLTDLFDPNNPSLFSDALYTQAAPSVLQGTASLESRLLPYLSQDTATCLVLAGYSQGAWVIGNHFYGNPAITARLVERMTAVVLLGDPRFDPTSDVVFGAPGKPGISRSGLVPADLRLPPTGDYYNGQSNRVHSYCTTGDPVCNFDPIGDPNRITDCLFPPANLCAHTRGYGENGYIGAAGTWAAEQVHAPAAAAAAPAIVGVSTYQEGVLVFASVRYTGDAVGFGFRGTNGSGWAPESHPFTSPTYGRPSPGGIDYPFNQGCGTGSVYESDIEFWVYDAAGRESPHVPIHLACSGTAG